MSVRKDKSFLTQHLLCEMSACFVARPAQDTWVFLKVAMVRCVSSSALYLCKPAYSCTRITAARSAASSSQFSDTRTSERPVRMLLMVHLLSILLSAKRNRRCLGKNTGAENLVFIECNSLISSDWGLWDSQTFLFEFSSSSHPCHYRVSTPYCYYYYL